MSLDDVVMLIMCDGEVDLNRNSLTDTTRPDCGGQV